MGKVFILLLTIILSIAAVTGYLSLTQKYTSGKQQIAEGEQQLESGQQMLAEGKAKLSKGKRKLSQAKRKYSDISHIPLMGVVKQLPVIGMAFGSAANQISQGKQRIAQGEESITLGEAKLAAGQQELNRGKKHLIIVNRIRITCAIAAFIFTVISILLIFYWRYSLSKFFTTKLGNNSNDTI